MGLFICNCHLIMNGRCIIKFLLQNLRSLVQIYKTYPCSSKIMSITDV